MQMHNSYEYGRSEFHARHGELVGLGISAVVVLLAAYCLYLVVHMLHIRPYQIVEVAMYAACFLGAVWVSALYCLRFKKRREQAWPPPPVHVPMIRDARIVRKAAERNTTLLAYENNGDPWFWSDEARSMQAVLLGMSGSGKSSLLHNIIGQDLRRVFVRQDRVRRMPMIILDGKGDQKFLLQLLPDIAAAGRLQDLRVLDLTRPDISARYNPLTIKDDSYQEHVNFIFESFGQKMDFFAKHQKSYFSDLVRVLVHAGRPINIRDVMIVALDERVLREQINRARYRIEHMSGISRESRDNFEMSVALLLESLKDKERILKIQGLLNELNAFLEDKMSVITGRYEDLLTLDDVIGQELILFVSLNVNINPPAVKALGKIILHNLQLMIGKRYANQWRESGEAPMVSVVLDEFSDFAYENFGSILQTARGTNTAILFSLQSISQLLKVSPGFMDDVSTAPNTVMTMLMRNEATAKFFREASGRILQKKLSLTVEQTGWFEDDYKPIGFGSESEYQDTRSQDFHLKNLPKGHFEILATDSHVGSPHRHLQARRPFSFRLPCFASRIYPRLEPPYAFSGGANLRFKDLEVSKSSGRSSGQGGSSSWY